MILFSFQLPQTRHVIRVFVFAHSEHLGRTFKPVFGRHQNVIVCMPLAFRLSNPSKDRLARDPLMPIFGDQRSTETLTIPIAPSVESGDRLPFLGSPINHT